jgi:hypothetical protein
MKYIINEHQYKLLTEEEEKVLKVPFVAFGNEWDVLQRFLERRGNPPYEIMDDLDLRRTDIESLGNLTSVGGDLNLKHSEIESLGNLTSVGGYFNLKGTKIKSLGNLTSVGGYFNLEGTKIKSLGNLTSVGLSLNLFNSEIESLGNLISVGVSLNLYSTPLSRKYPTEEEIRSMVEVGDSVYL